MLPRGGGPSVSFGDAPESVPPRREPARLRELQPASMEPTATPRELLRRASDSVLPAFQNDEDEPQLQRSASRGGVGAQRSPRARQRLDALEARPAAAPLDRGGAARARRQMAALPAPQSVERYRRRPSRSSRGSPSRGSRGSLGDAPSNNVFSSDEEGVFHRTAVASEEPRRAPSAARGRRDALRWGAGGSAEVVSPAAERAGR
jgi:hypothetical protein